MKTLLTTIYLYCLLTTYSLANSTVITFIADGEDWKENSSWDLNRIPKSGDKVIIPEGKTVEVSINQYNSVPSYPLVDIEIYGVLQFVGTGQLNVKCESTICTKGTGIILSTGCNCNQITMGPGLAPWKGSYPSVTNGQCVLSDCNTSLPIENLFFDVTFPNGFVTINWEGIKETQNKIEVIELERSSDGIIFSSIFSFKQSENFISFIDYKPLVGISYYRLKVSFVGGGVEYSLAKKVNNNTASEIIAYPNPTNGSIIYLHTSIDLYNSIRSVALIDQFGTEFSVIDYNKINSGIAVEPSSTLSSGLYTIILTTESEQFTTRLVIQE